MITPLSPEKKDPPATPHFQGTIFLAARERSKDLRRTFPSLGPHKRILNPPSCNQNIHSIDAIKKMLSSTNPASPSLNQNRNAKDEISAGPKQDLLPQTTTHILTIRALQNTNKADLLGHKHRGHKHKD